MIVKDEYRGKSFEVRLEEKDIDLLRAGGHLKAEVNGYVFSLKCGELNRHFHREKNEYVGHIVVEKGDDIHSLGRRIDGQHFDILDFEADNRLNLKRVGVVKFRYDYGASKSHSG